MRRVRRRRAGPRADGQTGSENDGQPADDGGPSQILAQQESKGHQEPHQGSGENERPRDGLPGAEFAREQATLRVSDGGRNDGAEEQQVWPVQLAEAAGLCGSEGDPATAPTPVMSQTQPWWHTHLRGLRHQLQARRDLLVSSLREHAPHAHVEHVPKGGLNLWARLPDGTDLEQLTRDCEAAGVVIAAGTEWFPAEPTGPFIRLNYAGSNPGAFPDGARILGQALDRHSH